MASTASRPAPLFTIGYEKSTIRNVLDTLRDARIDVVVDTRAVAASRRPGFSKRQLAAALDERGIRYVHLRGLGTPKDGRLAARAGKPEVMLRLYERHLATTQAKEELEELVGLARTGLRLCLLCYERDPAVCHRRRIAELVRRRLRVKVSDLLCAPV
jgi:uncharacterized protein (DUF488 family)